MEEMTYVTDDLSVWQMIYELSVFENFQIISVIFVFFVNFTEFLLKSDDWTSGFQKILKRQIRLIDALKNSALTHFDLKVEGLSLCAVWLLDACSRASTLEEALR